VLVAQKDPRVLSSHARHGSCAGRRVDGVFAHCTRYLGLASHVLDSHDVFDIRSTVLPEAIISIIVDIYRDISFDGQLEPTWCGFIDGVVVILQLLRPLKVHKGSLETRRLLLQDRPSLCEIRNNLSGCVSRGKWKAPRRTPDRPTHHSRRRRTGPMLKSTRLRARRPRR